MKVPHGWHGITREEIVEISPASAPMRAVQLIGNTTSRNGWLVGEVCALGRLLGSRNDQKKHLLYDTSHNLPRNEFIKETLNWLDQYLGPVR